MKKISICVCCYNEQNNIIDMYNSIEKQMLVLDKYDYEIIFEDNDSSDNTPNLLRGIAKQNKKVKVILNNKNFGVERSGYNCLINSSGDACIGLACDFQDPVEMIPEFIKYWEQGNLVVWGQKVKSKENKIKYLLRKAYYYIMQKVSSDIVYPQVTGFGLVDKLVVDQYRQCSDYESSLRFFVPQMGWQVKLIPYTQAVRRAGKSSYNISRYFDFAMTSVIQNSEIPLRLATLVGIFASFISFMIGVIYFIYKLIYWDTFTAGTAPAAIGLFFLGSVQLLFLGIIGEYIGKILKKVTIRPAVVEKERINFEEESELG